MTRVVVVDDSSFLRKALNRILSGDPRLEVVGTAASGEELLSGLDDWAPDVITLDLEMPGMGGLRALDQVMARRPTPVVILSSYSERNAPLTIEALHRGALDFIDKKRYSLVDFAALGDVLIEKILEVTAATPRLQPTPTPPATAAPDLPEPKEEPVPDSGAFDLVLIGASSGGPPAIQRVLQDLGPRLPVPVIVVQHMPAGFTAAFAERLNTVLPSSVREVADGELLLPATAYIAPAGLHLKLGRRGKGLVARLVEEPRDVPHRPAVDILFSSAARLVGPRAVAMLLTGMGSDGAAGMSELAKAGAHTVVQDRDSSVVFGMPRAALERQAVLETLSLEKLGGRVLELLRGSADS